MFLLDSVTDQSIMLMVIWILIFLIALAIEIATQELVSIWFSLSSIVPLILAAFNISYIWQILVYAIVSAILFILSEKIINKKIKPHKNATNADSLIGNEIRVLKDVSPDQNGEGKIRDIIWTIKSNDIIKEGEFAVVKEIKGNSLIVVKKEDK